MEHINVKKLKGRIIENGYSITTLAEKIGVDRASLYRKLSSGGKTMTVKDVNNIVAVLKLPPEDIMSIFFTSSVSKNETTKGEHNI